MVEGVKIDPQIEESWKTALENEFNKESFKKLKGFLLEEKRHGHVVFPPGKDIFSAFNLTPFHSVKAVILGQDPYHGPNQAHGLSFSVREGVPFPPSLRNICKELEADLGIPYPKCGDLTKWAEQGVFLLNAILTVRANSPASHQKQGWENFTDAVIKTLSDQLDGIVFILWGSYAQSKIPLIDTRKHLVIKSAHPSPLSAYNGFFGSKPFSKTNAYLNSVGKEEINWAL